MLVYILEVNSYGEWYAHSVYSTHEMAEKMGNKLEKKEKIESFIITDFKVDEYGTV
jgi:hypothetical protein